MRFRTVTRLILMVGLGASNLTGCRAWDMEAEYRNVVRFNNPSRLRAFCEQYPISKYDGIIKEKLEELEKAACERAIKKNRINDYLDFVSDFPEGKYRSLVKENFYRATKESDTAEYYVSFLKCYRDLEDKDYLVERVSVIQNDMSRFTKVLDTKILGGKRIHILATLGGYSIEIRGHLLKGVPLGVCPSNS